MGTYSNLVHASPLPSQPRPAGDMASMPVHSQEQTPLEPSTIPQRPNLPYKRRTKRSSFEFYEDQLLLLKKLVYDAAVNGENLSQSDIVRTALDEFLKNKR